MWCSRSTLLGMQLYERSSALNCLWMDSPPCSPRNPNPVLHFLIHGTVWSSKKCILGIIVACAKVERYDNRNLAIAAPVDQQ